ncbi:32096_t:CDS:2, partial [Gigaspora margarita]
RYYSAEEKAQIVQNMVIQESEIKDRRREDSKMPTINKKRKREDQEDHLDKAQEDPSTTISKEQQVNDETRNEAIAQEKILYSRALKSSLKDRN